MMARALALGIKSDRPVVPNVDSVPFTRLRFVGSEGPAIIAQYPDKLRWAESIFLKNGEQVNYFFTQVGVENNAVILHDRNRNIWIKVSRNEVHFSRGIDDPWTLIYEKK
jgi:hypothetical protein